MKALDPKTPQPEFIVVYTTHVYEEAHIIAGRLHSEDIPAMVQREAAAGALGLSVGRLGEVQVLVRSSDYDVAMSLLYPPDDTTQQLTDNNANIIYDVDEDGYDSE